MDFLNKAYAQVADLFRTMTPGARVLAGLLLVVIVVSLAFLFTYQSSSGPEEFLHGAQIFSSYDLQEMEKIFASEGLKHFTLVGSRVRVPHHKKTDYLAALAKHKFSLSDPNTELDNAIKGASPFDTVSLSNLRLKNSEEKQLGMILAKMSGVERANVKIDVKNPGGFGREPKASALVTVKPVGSKHLDESQVQAIRAAVAASNAMLKRENVAVFDQNAGRTWSGESGTVASDDPYVQRKLMYEKQWKEKIDRMLSSIEGVLTEVDVELDPQLESKLTEVTNDVRPVNIRTESRKSESTSKSAEQGGRPGAVPNGVGNQPAVVTAATGSEQQKTDESEVVENIPSSRKQIVSSKPALVPQRVKASIHVPRSYYTKLWQKQNPSKDGDKPKEPDAVALRDIETRATKSIEEIVVGLFPSLQPGVDKYPQVTVRTFEDMPQVPLAAPTFNDKALGWLADNWESLGLGFLGLFSLVMLRGMIRSGQTGPAAAVPQLKLADVEMELEDEEEEPDDDEAVPGETAEQAAERAKRRFVKGPNMRIELATMVKDDPDAAASVLRSWIGDAA